MKPADKTMEEPARLLMSEKTKNSANQEGFQGMTLSGLQCVQFVSIERFT